MVKRLIVGLVLGLVLGAVVAAVLVQGLGITSFAASGAVVAYVTAAVTGVLAGLVAGKPIWAADGKIEAGLKAFFGALLALGAMFALRQWVNADIDLSALKAGSGKLGDLPAATLPIIAALLSTFYELDNTGDGGEKDVAAKALGGKAEGGKASSGNKVRVSESAEALEDEDLEEPAAKKRR